MFFIQKWLSIIINRLTLDSSKCFLLPLVRILSSKDTKWLENRKLSSTGLFLGSSRELFLGLIL